MADAPTRGNLTDVLAGLAVVGVSGFFALTAFGYGLGSVSQMGAGFFPFATALLGLALGAAILTVGLRAPAGKLPPVPVRVLTFIAAAFVAFALMVDATGVVPAIAVSGMVAAFADPRTRPWEAAVLALGTAAGIWLVFIILLKLPLTPIAGF